MIKPPFSATDALREVVRYVLASRYSRLRQLQHLRGLDDRLLTDIGLTRWDPVRGRSHGLTVDQRGAAPRVAVRDAAAADFAAIQSIYAHEVLHGLATFEESPPSAAELLARRDSVLDLGLPYLVAELDGRVVGYAYASAYRPRPAYRNTVEDSVYVAPGMHGRGVGGALLTALVERCSKGTWRQMIAIIGNSGNAGSIALHDRAGFCRVGTLEAVGFKLGRWVDTVIMQRPLAPRTPRLCALNRRPVRCR